MQEIIDRPAEQGKQLKPCAMFAFMSYWFLAILFIVSLFIGQTWF